MTTMRTGGIAALTALLLFVVAGTAQARQHTTTLRWGPVELPPAANGQPAHIENEIAGLFGLRKTLTGLITSVAHCDMQNPCEDRYITGIKPNMVLADGTTANFDNGTMLHHVVNVNCSLADVTCRPRQSAHRSYHSSEPGG